VLQGSVLAHEHISYIRLRAKKYWGKNSKCGREEKSNLRTLNIEEALDIKNTKHRRGIGHKNTKRLLKN
jgi:hypothetical protein